MSKIQRVMIRSAIAQYLDSDRVTKRARNTRRAKAYTLEALARAMEGQFASAMTARHCEAAMKALRGEKPDGTQARSDVSLNTDRYNLKLFVEWLHDNKMLSPWERPAAGLDNVPTDPYAKPITSLILTKDQADRCLDVAAAVHPRDRMIIALGLYAMMRESELIDLQWGHVNLAEGFIEFPRDKQRGAFHRVPISKALRPELEKWKAWVEERHGEIQPTDYVIPARRAMGRGAKLNPSFPVIPERQCSRITPLVKEFFRAVGFEARHAGVHTLRRTGACHLFDATRDIKQVQRMLGHKTQKITEIYLKHREGYDELAASMDDYDPYNTVGESSNRGNVVPLRRVSNW